ncbi:MAG: hypothetical protein AAF961_03485 [Planctomycetota bacterium]
MIDDTGFSVPESKRERLASSHVRQNGKLAIVDKGATSPFREGFQIVSGGGGLPSTIDDYANFCQMLVNGGEFRDLRLLKRSTVNRMFADQLGARECGFRFGLGFAVDKAG